MKLMRLRPEVVRLRRVAKACAAGEVSRSEFRRARREVIADFAAVDARDVTQRRPEDATVPRMRQGRDKPATARKRPWIWMGLGILACVALLPAAGWSNPVIPPVNERHPDPLRALSMDVNEVFWRVPEQLPGIIEADVQAVLDAALDAERQTSAVGEHGFTGPELEQVARFLDALGVHDGTRPLTREDAADLKALVRRQKQQRGLTVVQLERVAQTLQSWVREQGYPLATAYVPGQQVRDGAVRIDVQVGLLAEVVQADSGAEAVTPLTHGLQSLLGKPVRRDEIETRLNVINGYTQDSVQAQFKPGAEVGESAMVLHVDKGANWRGYVQVDNHGQARVGEERLSGAFRTGDVWRQGDLLDAQLAASVSPSDQVFGNIGYLMPLDLGRKALQTRAGYTDIQDDLGDGTGVFIEAAVSDTRLFTRRAKRQLDYGVGVHNVDLSDQGDQVAWFGQADFSGHRLWDRRRIALQGEVGVRVGHMQTDGGGTDGVFWRLHGEAVAWTPVTLPWIDVASKVVLRAHMQTSGNRLPATLRYAAARPDFNPGLEVGALVLDEAAGFSSALRFGAPLGEWWVFGDATYGERNADNTWYELVSVGAGWDAELWRSEYGSLSSRLTIGYPVSHVSNGDLDDDGTQIFWSLRLHH